MEIQKNNTIIQDYEISLARIVLYGILELPNSFGIQKVSGFLRGSKSSFVIDNELYLLDMYGVLPNFNANYLKAIINKLLENGLLTIEMVSDYGNLPTLKVTSKGENFLVNKKVGDVKFVYELSNREVILLDAEEQILYAELKQLRWNIAREKELPAYTVCHDTHLREMAKKKPKSDDELLSISGIGKNFVQKYGDIFLSVINNTPINFTGNLENMPPNPALS